MTNSLAKGAAARGELRNGRRRSRGSFAHLAARDAVPPQLDHGEVALAQGALDLVEADADGARPTAGMRRRRQQRRSRGKPPGLGHHHAAQAAPRSLPPPPAPTRRRRRRLLALVLSPGGGDRQAATEARSPRKHRRAQPPRGRVGPAPSLALPLASLLASSRDASGGEK